MCQTVNKEFKFKIIIYIYITVSSIKMATKIKNYLEKIVLQLKNNGANKMMHKIVMGNESCDLDSAVSSIVYALHLDNNKKDDQVNTILPIMNIKREDYILRTEVNFCLNNFGILEKMLIFRDDIDLTVLAQNGLLELYIIDHNLLSSNDANLECCVVSVLDHHKLERTQNAVFGMIVEPVGSCATLVAEKIMNEDKDLLTEDVASLLYGTILVDTVNFSEAAQRSTPKDVCVIGRLESVLKTDVSRRSVIFEELMNAKKDVSTLTSSQILKKDLKLVSRDNATIAMSSIPLLAQLFLSRADASESLRNFCLLSDYHAVVVLGVQTDGTFTRDLAVFSTKSDFRKELIDHLNSAQSRVLQLEPIFKIFNSEECCVFHQGNQTASRKVILPLIKEWLCSKI